MEAGLETGLGPGLETGLVSDSGWRFKVLEAAPVWRPAPARKSLMGEVSVLRHSLAMRATLATYW